MNRFFLIDLLPMEKTEIHSVAAVQAPEEHGLHNPTILLRRAEDVEVNAAVAGINRWTFYPLAVTFPGIVDIRENPIGLLVSCIVDIVVYCGHCAVL